MFEWFELKKRNNQLSKRVQRLEAKLKKCRIIIEQVHKKEDNKKQQKVGV